VVLHAVNAADALHGRFLMVGRRWNVAVETPLAFGARLWEQELSNRAAGAVRLEMDYGAQADLDVILRAGIERAAYVIGLGAQRDAGIVGPVRADSSLKCETILA